MSSTTVPAGSTPGTFVRARRSILATVTALAFVLIVLPATASAVTTTWEGDVDGNWATAGNWDTGNAPTNADLAVINNTSDANLFPNPTVSTAGQAADAVTLSGSRVLNVTGGTVAVDNQITAPVGTNVNLSGGDLSFGTVLVDDAAGLTATGGALAGTLQATAATTLTNAGATYGTSLSTTDGVTLGNNVSVTQTASINMDASHFLNIDSHLYRLADVNITETAASTPTISIGSGGTLFHNGNVNNFVQPQINSDGTIHTEPGNGFLHLRSNGGGNANQLGGSLEAAGNGFIVLEGGGGAGDIFTVKTGGLTTSHGAGGFVGINDFANSEFRLNGQTVSMASGGFTWDGTGGGLVSGTGTFDAVSPSFGQFLIAGGDFATGANVTIPPDTTARIVAFTDWSNTFTFNVDGQLLLGGINLTASDAADTPLINISSTGTLGHTQGNGLVEPRVVSTNGTIEDNSFGILNLERVVGQTNQYSGTIRTIGGGRVRLGTEVHQLQGPLTMDTLGGGNIFTGGSADLQLNNQTLTLVGNSLNHDSGAISGTGTINGPGLLRVQGGDFAGGGALTVNAPTSQTSATDVAGAGSELIIGGDWTANENITFNGTGGTHVTVNGTLRHNGGPPSTVFAPLVVNGLIDLDGGTEWDISGGTTINSSGAVNVDNNELDIDPLSNLSGTTLSGGSYRAAGTLRLPGDVETLDADLTIDGGGSVRRTTDDGLALSGLDTITSSGSLRLTNGHTEDVAGTLQVNGTLAGDGTIVTDVVNNGTVSPGTSPGELDVTGNYDQTSSGTLDVEVEGVGVGEFDVVNVDGDVDLDGELALLPSADFVDDAQPGDRASFLRYTGGRTGTFDTTTVDPVLSNEKAFTADYVDPGQRVDALVGEEPPDVTAPVATITKKKITQERRDAKFKFTSNEAGSTFECKLDKRPWRKCASPRNYGDLDPGKHKFKVRATDPSGNTGPAAKKKFKIKA